MRDAEIFTAVRAALLTGLTAWTWGPVDVRQRAQGVTVGAATGPAVYLMKVASVRTGWPKRSEVWDAEAGDYTHVERQQMQTTIQASAIFKDGPDEVTAADLAEAAAMVLQASPALVALREAGAGVLQVSPVRNPFFNDGQAAYEFDPNFDLVLTHEQLNFSKTPGAIAEGLHVFSV